MIAVIYNGIHQAKVLAALPNGEVSIEFNDQNLIPPRMTVSSSYLQMVGPDGSVRPYVCAEFRCVKCDVPWRSTPGFRVNYYDYPICGARKEDQCDTGT